MKTENQMLKKRKIRKLHWTSKPKNRRRLLTQKPKNRSKLKISKTAKPKIPMPPSMLTIICQASPSRYRFWVFTNRCGDRQSPRCLDWAVHNLVKVAKLCIIYNVSANNLFWTTLFSQLYDSMATIFWKACFTNLTFIIVGIGHRFWFSLLLSHFRALWEN